MQKTGSYVSSALDGNDAAGSLGSLKLLKSIERKRRTAFVVKACYEANVANAPADARKLHALCMLTWTGRHIVGRPLVDNTKSVLAPAFSTLTGIVVIATTAGELPEALTGAGVSKDVVEIAHLPIGFVNFYAAYRNSSRDWMASNADAVASVARQVANAKSDADVRAAYQRVSDLPAITQPDGTRPMAAANLLTPMLACLDQRLRAPVLNRQAGVSKKLEDLNLSRASLVQKFDALVGLIHQYGVSDALALDAVLDREALGDPQATATDTAPSVGIAGEMAASGVLSHAPMKSRSDDDVVFFRSQKLARMRRVHRSMEKALLRILSAASLQGLEGAKGGFQFDVLVKNYTASNRDLLVELKSDCEVSTCRLAVGQLLDYRRDPRLRTALTDLAVLFPAKPTGGVLDYLGSVGVKPMWFSDSDLRRAAIETC